MDIRQMIHRVRALVTIALVLSFGLMSFSFVKYQEFQRQQILGCGVINEPQTPIHSQKTAELLPGFKLFKEWGCNTCHAMDKKIVGPALANIRERRPDEWLQKFITNSSAVIESGDEYAVALYNKFNRLQMLNHDMTNEDVTSILDYITAASKRE